MSLRVIVAKRIVIVIVPMVNEVDETLKECLHERTLERTANPEADVGNHAVAEILLVALLDATEYLTKDVVLMFVGEFPKLLLRGDANLTEVRVLKNGNLVHTFVIIYSASEDWSWPVIRTSLDVSKDVLSFFLRCKGTHLFPSMTHNTLA